jgi:DNA-binding GntR family transcriptional regulator
MTEPTQGQPAGRPPTGVGFRRPPTAQEAVLAELRRAIAAGDLAPGEQVRQDALAERFGVSRVPLREALKILEGEGQVTYRPHRGYFVAELDLADLREVYRIRDLLETEAIATAVTRIGEAELASADAAMLDVEQSSASGDLLAMAEANRRFHFALIEAAGMPRLSRLVRILWGGTDAYRSRYYADAGHRSAVVDEHREILRAVRAGDARTANQVLRRHRERAVDALGLQLAPQPAEQPADRQR